MSGDRLVFLKGANRTDEVLNIEACDGKWHVKFKSNPAKRFTYGGDNVQIYQLTRTYASDEAILRIDGEPAFNVLEVRSYEDAYYTVTFGKGKGSRTYPASKISLQENCLANPLVKTAIGFFQEVADRFGLRADDGTPLLGTQYERLGQVPSDAVLGSYLNPAKRNAPCQGEAPAIFPFGMNRSQKLAVEKALSSQVSIIQGPPGTGKTQTILNLIANIVCRGQTVAMCAGNNSATANVLERLAKHDVSFLAASLGSRENKERLIEGQDGNYPDMTDWAAPFEQTISLADGIRELSAELDEKLAVKTRIADINQELLELETEQQKFERYYEKEAQRTDIEFGRASSSKVMRLVVELEDRCERDGDMGIFSRLSLALRYWNCGGRQLLSTSPEQFLPPLRRQYYALRINELEKEKRSLDRELNRYSFEAKMARLSQDSMAFLKAALAKRYGGRSKRAVFDFDDLRKRPERFTGEYPVILSTTHSLRNSLGSNHLYDWLIVDEASQVDLATAVLAMSCARNLVVVGDAEQLPQVIADKQREECEGLFARCSLDERFDYARHSLLSSAIATWEEAPVTQLREHYRCHPKIIDFCNKEFYDNQLIVMTEDHGEPDVLQLCTTGKGNFARGNANQRQADVIEREILPKLNVPAEKIGVVTPYRDQVGLLKKQLGEHCGLIDTVHKFQGREMDAIVISTVSNESNDFVDEPHMVNVAVSRAIKSLAVVTSPEFCKGDSCYAHLTRHIEYYGGVIRESKVRSVFDLLYKAYAKELAEYLKRKRRVSEFDSENLMYSLIEKLFRMREFKALDCAVHVPMRETIGDFSLLDARECRYAQNPLAHFDFLVFNRFGKKPLLAIEVDGTRFHQAGSAQAERDKLKDKIAGKCGLPLVRFRTDGSGEEGKLVAALQEAIRKQ